MNEDPNDENNDIDNEEQSSENLDSSNRPSGIVNGIKNFSKRPLDGLNKTFKKGIKGLWARIPAAIKVKIIAGVVIVIVIIVIVLAAAFLWYMATSSSDVAKSSVNNYVDSLSDSTKKDDFTKKGSLINFSISDIDNIYNNFIKSDTGDKSTIEDMQLKFKDGNKSVTNMQSGAVSFNDNRELYKHILLTEKYNFNLIKWNEYKHGTDAVTIPQMVVDKDKGLQYPKDDSVDESQFLSMLTPYLQSWYIPLSMYSGTFKSGQEKASQKDADFAYQIISNAYSDITMNRYDLETLTKNYSQNVYSETKMEDRTTYTCNDVNKNDCDEVDSDSEIRMSSASADIVEPETEDSNSRKTSVSVVYNLLSAYTFDVKIVNEYSYIKYNENKTPDSSYVVDTSPYNADVNISYETKRSGSSKVVIRKYTRREGKTNHIMKTWSDKVEQENTSKDYYTVDDIKSYNSTDIDSSDLAYYQNLQDSNQLDRIMLINSKPDIFNKYLSSGSKYGNNIGFSKAFLNMSYSLLTKNLSSIGSDPNNLPFVYGQTLGINLNYSGSTFSGSIDITSLPEGGFAWPVPVLITDNVKKSKAITSPFNLSGNNADISAHSHGHFGIDISNGGHKKSNGGQNCGEEDRTCSGPDVIAAQSGVIYKIGNNTPGNGQGYGNSVVIKHDNDYYTLYGHLYVINTSLKVGDTVKAGQVIGIMGNTGSSQGTHLHFGVYRTTSAFNYRTGAIDPAQFFNDDLSPKTSFIDNIGTGTTNLKANNEMLSYLNGSTRSLNDAYSTIKDAINKMSPIEVMSRIIYGEGGNQPEEGKILIAITILNRSLRYKVSANKTILSTYTYPKTNKTYFQYNAVYTPGYRNLYFWKDVPDSCVQAAYKAVDIVNNKKTYVINGVECVDMYYFIGNGYSPQGNEKHITIGDQIYSK